MDGKVITKSPELDSPGHIDPVVSWVRKLGIRPNLLSGLEDKFQSLVKDEGDNLKGRPGDILLGVICDYKKQKVKSKWTELWPTQPGFVFKDGPKDNYQHPREDFRRKFKIAANESGKALGSPPDIAPLDFFVYCLFIYLLKSGSHRLRYADHTGGIIIELCKASLDFIAVIAQMVAVEEFEGKQNSEKKDRPAEATELLRESIGEKEQKEGRRPGRPHGPTRKVQARQEAFDKIYREYMAANNGKEPDNLAICDGWDSEGILPEDGYSKTWHERYFSTKVDSIHSTIRLHRKDYKERTERKHHD